MIMKGLFVLPWLFYLWMALISSAWAQMPADDCCVVAEGSAVIENGNVAFARQLAIKDAIHMASISHSVKVKSTSRTENYQLVSQNASFVSQSVIEHFEVDDEFEEEGVYFVRIKAYLSDAMNVCPGYAGGDYTNRLAVAQPIVEQPVDIRDIQQFEVGFQTELLRRLKQQGYLNVKPVVVGGDVVPDRVLEPNMSPALLDDLRRQSMSQYLLLTVVRSMALKQDEDKIWGQVKKFYGYGESPNYNQRVIEWDWYLVDLYQESIVHQHRFSQLLQADSTWVGRDKPMGTAAFFNTAVGAVVTDGLIREVNQTVQRLSCQTLQTEVIGLQGEDVVLLLNRDSGVQMGDELTVYGVSGAVISFNGQNLGSDYQSKGFLRIKRISSEFAIAEVIAKQNDIVIGDRVRAW